MTTSDATRRQKPVRSVVSERGGELVSRLGVFIVAVSLVAGVFAVYSPALNYQFVLDDHRFVGDPRLQSSGHVWEYFTSYVWAQVVGGPVSFYRPVFVLWLRLNFILSEMSPWGWHLLSIGKHLLVAVLLGLLVWKLLRDRVAALIAGTLFALHPAQTESVAWVTVPDPLMSAAVLGSVLLYLRYAESGSGSEQRLAGKSHKKSRRQKNGRSKDSSATWVIASAVACLAALMTKETALVLPMVFLAMVLIIPFGTVAADGGAGFGIRVRSAFRQSLPFLSVSAVYLLLRFNALGGRLSSKTQDLPWSAVSLSWPATLWFYVKVLLWPVRSRAFADPTLVDRFSLGGVLLPALGVGCAVAVLVWADVWAWKRARGLDDEQRVGVERALLLGTLILVLPILPTLNLNALNPGDFLHGRYTYLPLTGLTLLVATGWHLAKEWRMALLLIAGLVAFVFGVLTAKQESAWKDDLTVFTVAHEIAPHNEPVAQNLERAHVQVALGLDEAGRCEEAVPIFREAIQQYPQDWFGWAGLGECLVKLNDLPAAENALRRATELSHEARVKAAWEEVRARMGLGSE